MSHRLRSVSGIMSAGSPENGATAGPRGGGDRWILSGVGLLGFLGVLGGAVGAHPPGDFLADPEAREGWNAAVWFQLFHVLAIMALADWRSLFLGAWKGISLCFLAGTILFSGSIYALAAGAPGAIGPVTPIGGLLLLVGWLWLALRVGLNYREKTVES